MHSKNLKLIFNTLYDNFVSIECLIYVSITFCVVLTLPKKLITLLCKNFQRETFALETFLLREIPPESFVRREIKSQPKMQENR